jgi:hypothetical protein
MTFYMKCDPPTPLKGGLFSVFNRTFFMFVYDPPFRGAGGKMTGNEYFRDKGTGV